MLILLASLAALAEPCAESAFAPDLQAALRRADEAFVGMDRDAFHDAVAEVDASLACQAEPVVALDVAALHRVHGYLAFLDGEQAVALASFYALRATMPRADLPVDVAPSGHPLRVLFDDAASYSRATVPLPPPAYGWIAIDGRPATRAPAERPFVWQRFDGSGAVLETARLLPGAIPEYPLLPPPPEPRWLDTPRHKTALVLLSSGLALAGTGAALIGSAQWGADRYYPMLAPWDRQDYWLGQLAGRYWSGVAMVGLGAVGLAAGGANATGGPR